jgi:hypothetical protein
MSTTSPRPERLSAAVVALLLVGFFAWVLLTLPIQPAIILVVAGTLAWVGWVRISYANPVRSRKVIATYLCAVSFQLIHMAEEYTGGFPHEIVQLFHSSRPGASGHSCSPSCSRCSRAATSRASTPPSATSS